MAAWDIAAQVITNLLLFLLVMGMSSTVDIGKMKAQLRNWKAICTGLFCQFVLLPFLGWAMIMMFKLPATVGITLLVVVSSPGGSYSNWWCSVFNADLALSVSMTAMSTILSVGMLPANLLLYSHAAYGDSTTSSGESILDSLNFGVIFISIAVVIGAIGTGMYCSKKFDNPRFHKSAYIGGNVSGISLILFSVVLSFVGGDDKSASAADVAEGAQEEPIMYFAVALPCLLGLVAACILASAARLPRPERLTTAVECCYQNTGIATSAALSLFSGSDLNEAMRVPFIYGLVEAVFIGLFLIIGWKIGWSKAPKNERVCKVITKSYEIKPGEPADDGANEEQDEEVEERGSLSSHDKKEDDRFDDDNKKEQKMEKTPQSSDEFLDNA